MFTVQCPSCGTAYQLQQWPPNNQIQCSACGTAFMLQQPQQQAPQQPQPQPQQQPAPQPAPQPGQPGAPMPQQPGMPAPGGPQKSLAKPLIFGGVGLVGVAGLVLLFLFVIMPMIGGGLPGWAKAYIPDDCTNLRYMDVAALRESELGSDVDDYVERTGLNVDADDVSAIFRAGTEDGGFTIYRTEEDIDLDKFVEDGEEGDDHKDVETMEVGFGTHVAKLDKKTFCVCGSRDMLEEVIEQADEGEKYDLDEDMQKALGVVSGHHVFFVGSVDSDEDDDPEVMATGVSISSRIKVDGYGLFKNEDAVEETLDELDEERKKAKEAAEREETDEAEARAEFWEQIEAEADGEVLRLRVNYKPDEDMWEDVAKAALRML